MDQLSVGQTYSKTVTVTEEMIEHFAQASLDTNPLHLDEEFAGKTIFKRRVAHGMLTAGLVSGVYGTEFPGIGTIYVSQTLKFTRPIFIGDEVTMSMEIIEKLAEKGMIKLDLVCTNQDGKPVVLGESVLMPPK